MAFNGKYEIESEKNYDEFMKRLGEWGPKNIFPGWSVTTGIGPGTQIPGVKWDRTSVTHSFTPSFVEPLSQALGPIRTK